jgi:hypothetical protein
MKNNIYTFLIVVLGGALAFFNLPWWIIAVAGALAGFLLPQSPGKGYASAFSGGFGLWYGAALMADVSNTQKLSAMVGEIFLGLKGWHLLTITGFIGGLLAGLGLLTGLFARRLLKF